MVTQNTLRTRGGKQIFLYENTRKFVNVVDLHKCLKQIKLPVSLNTCAPCSVPPSYISRVERGGWHLCVIAWHAMANFFLNHLVVVLRKDHFFKEKYESLYHRINRSFLSSFNFFCRIVTRFLAISRLMRLSERRIAHWSHWEINEKSESDKREDNYYFQT